MANPTLLVVDDSMDDVSFVRRALKKGGVACDLHVAGDGAEALDVLLPDDRRGITPGMVLLDLKMPKVDGFEVLERLRADDRTRHLPVVVFSSSSEESDIIRAHELGASSFVRKPVDYGEFGDTVRAVVHYWLHVAAPMPDPHARGDAAGASPAPRREHVRAGTTWSGMSPTLGL